MEEEHICEICGQPLETEEEIQQGYHNECSLNQAAGILATEDIPPNADDLI